MFVSLKRRRSDGVEGSETVHQFYEPVSVELFLGETVLEHKLLDAKNGPFDNNHVGVAVDASVFRQVIRPV